MAASQSSDQLAPHSPSSDSRSQRFALISSALVSGLGVLASRILGLIRDTMTARYLPLDVRDAFFVAFRLPNIFRRIFGEGALSASITPVLIEILTTPPVHGSHAARTPEALPVFNENERARQFVAAMFSITLVFTMVISLLAILFMDQILGLLLSGSAYLSVPGKFSLTVQLAQIMFGFLVLVCLYAYLMALLHSVKKFAAAAFAPVLFNVTMILAARLGSRWADEAVILAWAVIVGGILQLAVLLPFVVKHNLVPKITWRWEQPDVLKAMRKVLPGLFGLSVMQMVTIVNLHFASQLAPGSQSYLYLADRLLELPLSLFVVSLGSALLPTLATQWVQGDRENMKETINHAIRLIIFLALPASLGLYILAHPITEVLFMGGQFKYQEALATAQIIQIYAIAIVFLGGVRVLAQGFYAIGNSWFPALAAAVALISHIILAWALTGAFGLVGLSAATVGSALVNVLMLATAYHAWVGSLEFKKLARSVLVYLLCGLCLALVLASYQPLLDWNNGRYLRRSWILVLEIGLGGFAYFAAAHALRVQECREMVEIVFQKFKVRRPA